MFSRVLWAIIGGLVVGGAALVVTRFPQRIAAAGYERQAAEVWKQGNTSKASSLAEMALRLDPNRARVYDLLGNIAQTNKEYDRALEYYREALKRSPGLISAAVSTASILVIRGDVENAKEILDTAIQVNPRSEQLIFAAGLLMMTAGPSDAALSYLQQALALNSTNPEIHSAIGNIYFLRHDYQKALEAFERALQLSETATTRANVGTALYRLENYDEAVKHLEKAVAMDADLAEAYATLGFTYQKAGRPSDAETMLTKYLALAPSTQTQMIEQAKATLDALH